jgi:hypothetical protein
LIGFEVTFFSVLLIEDDCDESIVDVEVDGVDGVDGVDCVDVFIL